MCKIKSKLIVAALVLCLSLAAGCSGPVNGNYTNIQLPEYQGGFFLGYFTDSVGLLWFELTETADFAGTEADSASLLFHYTSDPGFNVPQNGEYRLGYYTPSTFTPIGGASFQFDSGNYHYSSRSGTLLISGSGSAENGSYTLDVDGIFSQTDTATGQEIEEVAIKGSRRIVQYPKPAVFE